MADPIIRILIEEGGSGTSAGGGQAAPQAGQQKIKPSAVGQEDEDESGQVGKSLRSLFGRLLPGGQRTLKVLGLDDTFDTIAQTIGPALKKISSAIGDFVKDVVSSGGQAKSGGGGKGGSTPSGSAKDMAQEFLGKNGGQGFNTGSKMPDFASKAPGGMTGDVTMAAEGGGSSFLTQAAGAAGPIGIAILALQAIGEVGEKVANSLRGLGQVGAEIVQNNPGAAMRRVADGIIETVDEIPIIGKALTVNAKIFLAVADAATQLRDAFLENARKLAAYSGPLSAAESLAEVRHILADLEEAQRSGPALAKVVELQSQIDVELQRAMTPIKEDILEFLTPLLGLVADMATFLHAAVDGVHEIAKSANESLRSTVPGFKNLQDFLFWAKNQFGGHKQGKDDFNALAQSVFAIDPGRESGVPFTPARPPSAPPPPNNGFGGAGG